MTIRRGRSTMRFLLLLLLAVWGGLACPRGLVIGSNRPTTPAGAPLEKIDADPRGAGGSPTTRLGGYAHISKRVVQDFLNRDITFNETVAEPILNMTTRGRARVDCQIGFELLPNPRAASLRVLMTGRAIMDDAVSARRSVRVFSSSQTRISGYQDVVLDAEGLHLAPARVSGSTSIQVHGLDAPRFVERPAWRRVGRMQPQAEQAAASRGARRAEQHLESEVAKSAAHLRHKYVEQALRALSDAAVFPDTWLATTSDHLSVRLLRPAALVEPGPVAKPPRVAAWDLAVLLKDSFVIEMITPFVAGKTFTDRDFADVMLTLTGKTPRPLWVHARTEPWNVTAAKERPFIISFAGEGVSIKLRIDHASRGQQRLDRTLEVSARYTLEITPDGPHLIRSGDLAVEFTDAGQQRLDTDESEFREFLERKFNGVFLRDIYFDGLMPPQGASWGELRRLELKQLSSRDGWFAIGYELRSTSQIASAGKSTIAP
jgi:hypothetical protein